MPLRLAAAAAAAGLAGLVAAGCGSAGHSRSSPEPGVASVAAAPGISAPATALTTTSTTVATTTTTVDPGALPQTRDLPSGQDPAFLARVGDLWQAVVSGDPAAAQPAFFPLDAYIQVKAISDPVHDYDTRLVPDYDEDIGALHAQIGPGAVFQSVSVPATAQWIVPGVEYNKGSYWRVYGARVTYLVGGRLHYFTIASMISWRGEWYVVHLQSIR